MNKPILASAKQILMNTEMARAVLDGRKSQTRRVIKSHIDIHSDCKFSHQCSDGSFRFDSLNKNYFATIDSKHKKGDILWVREPVQVTDCNHLLEDSSVCRLEYKYKSDKDWERRIAEKMDLPERLFTDIGNPPKWALNRQSIPNGCIKEMARIFLRVTNVRVERLQDISDEDCLAEGIKQGLIDLYKNYIDYTKGFIADKSYEFYGRNFSGIQMSFFTLISSISGEEFLQSNPYMFVYEFERVEK